MSRYGYGYGIRLAALRFGGRAASACREEDGVSAQERAWTFSRSKSTAARSPRLSGARLGAITWSRSATTPTACRAAEPMSATARFVICVSPKGDVEARVAGSELYTVKVQIKELSPAKWRVIKQRSAGKIGSLLELLQGRLSDEVMRIVTDQKEGLFPLPKEISFRCDCPDWAGMCKHIAAVMYGVGARLDVSPDLLFTLRGVDHEELIAVDTEAAVSVATSSGKSKKLAASNLSDVFGIDLDSGDRNGPDHSNAAYQEQKENGTTASRDEGNQEKNRQSQEVQEKPACSQKPG